MITSKQVKKVPNPTGKGGFQERPQDRSKGHWDSTMVFSYQYRRFMNMSYKELAEWLAKPDDEKKVVEDLAYQAVRRSKASLADVREITDRTEGKAPQAIDLTSSDGTMTPQVIIESVYATKPNFRPDNSPTEADDVAADSSTEPS